MYRHTGNLYLEIDLLSGGLLVFDDHVEIRSLGVDGFAAEIRYAFIMRDKKVRSSEAPALDRSTA